MVGALRVGIFGSEPMQRRLQAATNRPVSILSTMTELEEFARAQSLGVLFVDPSLIPREHRLETMERLSSRPQTEVILYTKMSPDVAEILLEAGKIGFRRVVLFGVDDEVNNFTALLASVVARLFPPSGCASA